MQNNITFNPKIIQRKSIKTSANCIGGAFLIGAGGSLVLQYIILFLLMIFGKTQLLSDEGFTWMLQIALSTLIFTIPFCIMTYPMGTSPARCCAFGKAEKGTMLPLVLIGLAVCMVANLLGSMFSSVFSIMGIESTSMDFQSDILKGWYFPIISIIGGAILPALVEEFALRGIVLGSLRRFGDRFAIIVSAALFGLMHGNLEQIPFAFVLGLYFGFITVKTGTVWAAVLLHFINNACAYMFDIVANIMGQGAHLVVNAAYAFIMLLLGFIGIAKAKDVALFTLPQEENSQLSLFQKIGVYFSSPCIIIYIIYVFFEIILL